MADRSPPRLSCILTAYNEGALAHVSIDSVLAQSNGDFELLIVDDGASEATRETLHRFDDPRIVHIRQANDGLSSARNRAISVARGEYICFLDADDTRPPWAFEAMLAAAKDRPDVVFSPGVLVELRKEILPFYDQVHFDRLSAQGQVHFEMSEAARQPWLNALHELACVEPQSANKMVRRDFLEQYQQRFPAGLFFEDMIFHYSLLMNMRSFAVTTLPTFTYFRRYGRPQITAGQSITRYDAVSTAANALHLFAHSEYFPDVVLRGLVLASAFKLLRWCEESVSHEHRYSYGQAIRALVSRMDKRYRKTLDPRWAEKAYEYAPWVEPTLGYVAGLRG